MHAAHLQSSSLQPRRRVHMGGFFSRNTKAVEVQSAVNVEQLKALRSDLAAYIKSKNCNPIVIRLGWHDSGTYDKNVMEPWPKPGGAVGSIRFMPELGHAANAGLSIAVNILEPFKQKYPDVSYADLYQMASAVAIEEAGGPKVPMRYGRKEVESTADCSPEGNLPAAAHPFPDGSGSPAEHLRKVFYRMGLDDKDIVALSGAHTLGRSRPERSGFGKTSTKYTENGPGTPGGQSWTPDWLVFNNSYFVEVKAKRDEDLLVLPSDAAVFEDPVFAQYAEKYAADEKAFFEDYAQSHKKLSELGSAWAAGGPVTLD